MSTVPEIVVDSSKERYYIDITTRGINTNTGVSGTNDTFNATIESLQLDYNKNYNVKVYSWFYINENKGANIFPIILSDIAENIRVVNTNSSVLYKSRIEASNTNTVTLDSTNNAPFLSKLERTNINSINFQIVRSDDGLPFTMANPHTITLLIESE